MDAVKRWAIIENNKVVNVIIADEKFIQDQGFNAIEDSIATVGLDVDEDGNIIHLENQFLVEFVETVPVDISEETEEPITE
jgi:hypothetical protein